MTAADGSRPASRTGVAADEDAGEAERSYSIGALADEFGITTRTIRFYESRGLISPQRKGTNRVYSRRDRGRLILILRGKNLGFTLEDIAEYLALYDDDPSQRTQTEMLMGKLDAAIADLIGKRSDLERSIADLQELRGKCLDFLARSAGAQRRTRPTGD
ncbi:MAG: MerR family DNA-binding transcriptional regulator [Hyphomicrobiaceae bacterium]